MAVKPYDKLVRDRIPEIIRAEGRTCEVEAMDAGAYRKALRAKAVEEAQEVAAAEPNELAEEIADLREVLDALERAGGLDPSETTRLQAERRRARGGYEKRLRLLKVTDDA